MNSLQDLFEYELSGTLDAERTLLELLPRMADQAITDAARDAILHHLEETGEQVTNLERCLEILGATPLPVRCHALHGLALEREAFMAQKPSRELAALHDLGVAMKNEHFEVAAYRGLITKASLLGWRDLIGLLEQNLRQETAMARRLEELAPVMGQRITGTSPGIPVAEGPDSAGTGDTFTATTEGSFVGGSGFGSVAVLPGEGGLLTGPSGARGDDE